MFGLTLILNESTVTMFAFLPSEQSCRDEWPSNEFVFVRFKV